MSKACTTFGLSFCKSRFTFGLLHFLLEKNVWYTRIPTAVAPAVSETAAINSAMEADETESYLT